MSLRIRGLLSACHPGPALVVTVVAVLLGVAVGYEPARLVLLGAAILAGQLSVGWSNDWLDAARDTAVHRRDKPIARGMVSVRAVALAATIALIAAITLTLWLGPGATVVHVIALAAAWSYNVILKSTPFSVVPYLISFGLLPAIVTLGATVRAWPAFWVIAVGALLGAAAHFTNVLPDLDDDAKTGIRGLPHIFGAVSSGLIAFACLLIASVLTILGAGASRNTVTWIGFAVAVALAVVGVVLTARGVHSRTLMRLIMASAIVAVMMLVSAGASLRS